MKDELGLRYVYQLSSAKVPYYLVRVEDSNGEVLGRSEIEDYTLLDLFAEVYVLHSGNETVIITSKQLGGIIIGGLDSVWHSSSHSPCPISLTSSEAL